MTAGFDDLRAELSRWDSRRRRAELMRRLPQGLLIGLALGLAVALISRARPWLARGEIAQVAILLAITAAALATLIILLRRRSAVEQARFADRQFGLRERMITAVEVAQGDLVVDSEIAAHQLRDALAVAGGVDVTRQLPLKLFPTDWLLPLAVASLLALALWLPNPMESVLLEQRAVAALVEEQAATLADLAEAVAANDALTPQQREMLLRPLDDALAELAEPNVSREEAVAALSSAEAELRQLSQDFATTALGEAAQVAAAALGDEGTAAGLAEALESGNGEQAAAAATDLAEALSGLSPEARVELSEQLAAAAETLAGADGPLADSLARAAKALSAGDVATGQQALSETAAALAERAAAATAAEQAASVAERIGDARREVAQGGAESGGGAGESPTQEGGGDSGGATTDGSAQPGAGAPVEGGGHVENVYVPSSVPLDGEGEAVELETQCLTDSEACGPAVSGQSTLPPDSAGGQLVPYNQVLGDYRDAAFEALSEGSIPVRLQGLIRDYFAALEP